VNGLQAMLTAQSLPTPETPAPRARRARKPAAEAALPTL